MMAANSTAGTGMGIAAGLSTITIGITTGIAIATAGVTMTMIIASSHT